jgi:hypothetical protein
MAMQAIILTKTISKRLMTLVQTNYKKLTN